MSNSGRRRSNISRTGSARVLRDFEKKVKERGFEVVQVQGSGGNRPEIAPLIDGAPSSMDQLRTQWKPET